MPTGDAIMFQHTAARRRLPAKKILELLNQAFQHTAARRRLLSLFKSGDVDFYVSTHSRPKAAAKPLNGTIIYKEFQHTATRRWLRIYSFKICNKARLVYD